MSNCPNCGTPVNFVQQYNQWFCSRCNQYVTPTAPGPAPGPAPGANPYGPAPGVQPVAANPYGPAPGASPYGAPPGPGPSPAPAKSGGNKTIIIVAVVCGVLLVLSLCCGIGYWMMSSSTSTKTVGEIMADYDTTSHVFRSYSIGENVDWSDKVQSISYNSAASSTSIYMQSYTSTYYTWSGDLTTSYSQGSSIDGYMIITDGSSYYGAGTEDYEIYLN